MTLQDKLLEWYRVYHRKLPFRETNEAYRIWVSEIMLQQTQMDTVIPYYLRFMAQYPSVYELSQAKEEEVFKLWEGLGYYSRAKNMIKCAQVIVDDYHGIFPNQYDQMVKLPGIGPYTAGAILSIAYNLPYAAVDGNVMRVISRLYGFQEDIALPKTKALIENQVCAILPQDTRHFNQALMELGAMICTPKSPKCVKCPLLEDCVAYSENLQEILPNKSKKQKSAKIYLAVAMIEHEQNLLLYKPQKGLLAGLWGFPSSESKDHEHAYENLQKMMTEDMALKVISAKFMGEEKHVFTHKTWMMAIYHLTVVPNNTIGEEVIMEKMTTSESDYMWIAKNRVEHYPISNAYKKALKYL